jgi:hypothetical protein
MSRPLVAEGVEEVRSDFFNTLGQKQPFMLTVQYPLTPVSVCLTPAQAFLKHGSYESARHSFTAKTHATPFPDPIGRAPTRALILSSSSFDRS